MNDLPEPSEAAIAALGQVMANIPYARTIGFSVISKNNQLTGHLQFAEHIIGNHEVNALHGGIVAALLNLTATAQLMAVLETDKPPQIFSTTIEYLASPKQTDTYATAIVVARSRRFANLRVVAYQGSPDKIVATATMQFVLI